MMINRNVVSKSAGMKCDARTWIASLLYCRRLRIMVTYVLIIYFITDIYLIWNIFMDFYYFPSDKADTVYSVRRESGWTVELPG